MDLKSTFPNLHKLIMTIVRVHYLRIHSSQTYPLADTNREEIFSLELSRTSIPVCRDLD
jgi:hypothetical protein